MAYTGAMKAISLVEPGRFEMVTVADAPPPGRGQALVRVRRVGVCGTDLHAFAGDQPFFEYPRILGHELGVEVAAVGEGVEGVSVGDRCAVEPYLNCGRCIACRRGRTNCCATLDVLGVHIDGGLRPLINVPAHKLHRSDALSLEQLALVETLCIGCHAVGRAAVERGEWTLVIGAGPIGLGVMRFALAAGAKVIAMDIHPPRLAFARERIGVEHCIDAGARAGDIDDAARCELIERLAALTAGDLPTTVFDATGSAASMTAAFDYIAPSGQLVLVGIAKADVSFHDPHVHRREITMKASRNATANDFAHVIAMIEQHRVDTTPWITHRAAFDEMIGQFPSWTKPETGVVKAVVEMGA